MKIKRKLFAILAMVLCIGALAGCAKQEEEDVLDAQMAEAIVGSSETILENLAKEEDENVKIMIEQYEDDGNTTMANALETWLNTRPEVGEFVEFESSSAILKDRQYVAAVNAVFEKRPLEATIIYDKKGVIINMEFSPVYTVRENMGRAAVHTLIGMGTVFIVLIFISLIIGCFKYINQWEKKKAASPAPSPAPSFAPAPASEAAASPVEDLTDDLELVAVITAAIAASMNTSTDGLVVRSIKRKSGAKWKRA
ncbi:MAG: OadG family protein [Lachnospiraceae bacterium]|jgi:sodium pump decarboxylase gamma subunit|nr:OadG family protein [Lachnospiraceae bacterium]